MKRTAIYFILFAVAILFCCGCQLHDSDTNLLPEVQPRKIIIDTDTGADDAAAIIMAALQPEIDILGVTVLAGNVSLEQAAKNALMSLEVAGKTDVPVYCGTNRSIAGDEYEIFSVFGTDGMGDAGLIQPSQAPEKESAIAFILDAAASAPGEVEIIALGPVTNIAMAIEENPSIMKTVKRIWVMGTAGFGPGNATPVAEFNTFMDPDAFKILADSGLPVTVIGLDTNVESTYLTRADQEVLMQGNDIERFVGTAMNGYMEYNRTVSGEAFASLSDPIAMACLLWEDYILETVSCHASVITTPGETFGQVVFYREGESNQEEYAVATNTVDVVSETRSDKFKLWFMETLKNGKPK